MKKGFKRSMLIVVAVVAMFVSNAFVLTGCVGDYDFTVGINQLLQHPALDQSRIGFMTRLDELMAAEGKTVRYIYQNALAERTNAQTISNTFVAQRVDMIFALGTASAQTARDAAMDDRIPVVYGAITAPEAPGTGLSGHSHVTGTSDRLDMKSQVELIKELLGGEVNSIAYIFTAAEDNSRLQGELLETAANELGVSVNIRSINAIGELEAVMTAIRNGNYEAIYIGTDNLLAGNMALVAALNADGPRLPIVTGAAQMAEQGGVAAMGVNYTDVGIYAAEMAFEILFNDVVPGTIPPMYFDEDLELLDLLINKRVAADIGFTIPQALIDRADRIIPVEETPEGCGSMVFSNGGIVIFVVLFGALSLVIFMTLKRKNIIRKQLS